jgi:integrase/recombinase XerD
MSELTTVQNNNTLAEMAGTLDNNPAAAYLAGLSSPASRKTMLQCLNRIANHLTSGQHDAFSFTWWELRRVHTLAIRAALQQEDLKAATVNKHLCALRGVMREAWRLGLMSSDDHARAADLPAVTGETIPAGRELSSGEIAALMQNCQGRKPADVRDAAIIGILYSCGLRRAEVVALDLSSYDAESGRLVVHGKRNKERLVYVVNGAAAALGDWLELRGDQDGPLFQPINKGGVITTRRLSTQSIYNMLARRGRDAGIRDFSPHDFRRTMISHLLDAGADISTVQKLAGHASPTTTARYDRRPEAAKAKAAGLLHVPYMRVMA